MIILTKILLISLFCCGWRKATDEGMVLHGFKLWLNRIVKGPQPEFEQPSQEFYKLPDYAGKALTNNIPKTIFEMWEARGEWFLMPVVNCLYCYPSFWGTIVYWLLTVFVFPAGVNIQTLVAWPVCCVAAVFINGLLYGVYSHYEQFMN